MQAKNKPKKVGRPRAKRVCCPLFRKLKPDIGIYPQKLIEAEDDSSKMKWAWVSLPLQRRSQKLEPPQRQNHFFVLNAGRT